MLILSLIIVALFQRLIKVVTATEEQCHIDCSSSTRSPTRPWHAFDPLRSQLHLTRPYPYHIAADNTEIDIDEYALPEFCKLGCTYFFVSSDYDPNNDDESQSKTTTLGQCLDKCDDKYSYNSSTPPYNDLAEVARLECRDGCILALKRCQPGYNCLQVSFLDDEYDNAATDDDDNGSVGNNSPQHYQGGEMIPCPAGTYRDVSYDSVIECIPCPSNYFREDVKGKSLSSCSPCPAGTSAVEPGSTSIKDCVRCPAGTFSTEASFCMCITPQACADDQLPPPADAEKSDTVPYIGRW